jgi:hypothetical protein
MLRHDLFGSVLTKGEIASWKQQAPSMTQNETEFVPKFNSFVDTSIANASEARARYEKKGQSGKVEILNKFIEELERSKISSIQKAGSVAQPTKLDDGSMIFPDGSRVDANGKFVGKE